MERAEEEERRRDGAGRQERNKQCLSVVSPGRWGGDDAGLGPTECQDEQEAHGAQS